MNTFISPDLIFFIVVAALLILKLKSVLGRRTGNEKRPKNFSPLRGDFNPKIVSMLL